MSEANSLEHMFARKARGLCPICGARPPFEFKDRLSEKEYRISGMCQLCQDKVFVPVSPGSSTTKPVTSARVHSFLQSHVEHQVADDDDDHSAHERRERKLEDAGTDASEVNEFKRTRSW